MRLFAFRLKRGWGKFRIYLKREADVMRRLPERSTTSAAGSSRVRLVIDSGHFGNAAGPEWNVPFPWHDHSCHEHRQRHDATWLRFRDVPPPCCGLLSCVSSSVVRRMSALRIWSSKRHPQPGNDGETKNSYDGNSIKVLSALIEANRAEARFAGGPQNVGGI
jgi:hypothetical protein